MMNKYLSLSIISISGILGCTSADNRQTKQDLPNIVIFLADDQGYGDFSVTGNTNLNTPNIDRLAAEGTLLTHFYVSPVCAPTRAEFLTGRYHARSGVYLTHSNGELMDLDETTIAEVFKKAGYATGIFGKWHNGMQHPYHPNARGFDEFYGFSAGHLGHYFSPMLEHNGQLVRGDGYIPDDLTNKAMEFIRQHKKKPFFVYVPYNTPHSPMQVPDEYWDRFKDKELVLRGTEPQQENILHTKAALAMCENIDWNVGRLLTFLKENGLEKNTIVLYFNDNGPNGNRWRDGMKGTKGSTDEGGVRSPLFIKWPVQIPAGKKIPTIAAAIDLLPTLADMAGIEFQTNHPLDGISLKPVIIHDTNNHPDRVIFSYWSGRLSARNQQYRYTHDKKLNDMYADPGQSTDVAAENPETVKYLARLTDEFRTGVVSELSTDLRPYPVGHPDFKYTQLPAADGESSGGIVRSNRWPSSSFFTKWNSLEGKITFQVEVLEEGEFDVDIYYTCPEGQQGSEIKIAFKDNYLLAKVPEAHDPPLLGVEEDRFVRVESYEKDFASFNAGKIKLSKGQGEFSLQAVNIADSVVMDFSTLMLSRIK
jgi:arylsulfatase A-like enzyme